MILLTQLQYAHVLTPAEVLRDARGALAHGASVMQLLAQNLRDVHHQASYASARRIALFGVGAAALATERATEVRW